jgi:hypothetical protein
MRQSATLSVPALLYTLRGSAGTLAILTVLLCAAHTLDHEQCRTGHQGLWPRTVFAPHEPSNTRGPIAQAIERMKAAKAASQSASASEHVVDSSTTTLTALLSHTEPSDTCVEQTRALHYSYITTETSKLTLLRSRSVIDVARTLPRFS